MALTLALMAVACGVDVSNGDAGDHAGDDGSSDQHDDDSGKRDLTDAQLVRLQDALEDDALGEVISGARTPTITEIQAILACGVNLAR